MRMSESVFGSDSESPSGRDNKIAFNNRIYKINCKKNQNDDDSDDETYEQDDLELLEFHQQLFGCCLNKWLGLLLHQ